jgi:uncharacterized protein
MDGLHEVFEVMRRPYRSPFESSWIQTASGGSFNAFDIRDDDIDIEDIAHATSMICRFNGHTSHFYSVAEHCVMASLLVPEELALTALLHDAGEAYLTDVPSPIKRHLPEVREIEDSIMERVVRKFGGIFPFPDKVKEADVLMLGAEARQLMGGPEWSRAIPVVDVRIRGWSPPSAKYFFLERFRELTINSYILKEGW